jgi:hypothetical protein
MSVAKQRLLKHPTESKTTHLRRPDALFAAVVGRSLKILDAEKEK